MYIRTNKNELVEWSLGSPLPWEITIDNIIELQVKGQELEIIKKKFTNIPLTTNNVIVWHGDMAKFIVDNLN